MGTRTYIQILNMRRIWRKEARYGVDARFGVKCTIESYSTDGPRPKRSF